MSTPDDTTPPMCIGCDQRPTTRDSLTCRPCRNRLEDLLNELPDHYDRLDATPGSAGLTGAPAAPGFESRSPARDAVLVLTDRRRQAHDPEQPRNASSLLRTLAWWADEARDAGIVLGSPRRSIAVDRRGLAAVQARTVRGECAALARAVGRLGAWWAFGDMLANLDAQAGHLRRAIGEHEPTVPLGRCPRPPANLAARHAALVDDFGEILAARIWWLDTCGGEVRARAFGESARCRSCGWRWEGLDELRLLAAGLGDAMLDLPGIARYLGVESLATLRSWAMRDGWIREKVGRRTLYRLDDARGSWWRALERRQRAAQLDELVPGGVGPHVLTAGDGRQALCGGPGWCEACDAPDAGEVVELVQAEELDVIEAAG